MPAPTNPPLFTMNAVCVEDPTTKAGAVDDAIMLTERSPHGVEDEMPSAPYTFTSLKAAVDDACMEYGAARNHSGVVVPLLFVLKFVAGVKGKETFPGA